MVLAMFFHIMGTYISMFSLRILFPGATKIQLVQTYLYPISIVVVKNIGSNQSKQILPTVFTNITIDKMAKRIEYNTTLDLTGDKVVTRLLINFKFMLIVV